MEKIIYIADPEILAIPVVECHEPLVDAKDSDVLLYGPPPECELTTSCYTKMRKTVFEKLCAAERDLPRGWRLRLYEGFRSLEVQQMLFELEHQRVRDRLPEINTEDHFREVTRLISPVRHLDGSLNIPPHNTGAAIDVEILKEDGELLDMGMTAKDWVDVSPELCMTKCHLLDKKMQKNRDFLLELMQAHGFVNYPTEWWHFSYGDRYWAYFKKAPAAFYGSAE